MTCPNWSIASRCRGAGEEVALLGEAEGVSGGPPVVLAGGVVLARFVEQVFAVCEGSQMRLEVRRMARYAQLGEVLPGGGQ